MFFSIGPTCKDSFPNSRMFGKLGISLDHGWYDWPGDNCHYIYKGYMDHYDLHKHFYLADVDPELAPSGNYCVMVFNHDTSTLKICAGKNRSFPIWYSDQEITNLYPLENSVWSDSQISIDKNLTVDQQRFNAIGNIDTSTLDRSEVVAQVDQILSKKISQLLQIHASSLFKVFLSGGVDTLLVYSYIQKYTKDFELIKCQHLDFDRFYLLNQQHLNHLWAYRQIHHWNDHCFLASGTPGDEFMLRSPVTANLFLMSRGTSILQELNRAPGALHETYFRRTKHLELFDQQTPILDNVNWNLCNIVVNDFQHWHLGKTLTYTPLRDLEMFKLFLRLPTDAAIGQIINSDISRELIEKNCPGLSALISDQKNTGSQMKNLVDFFQNH